MNAVYISIKQFFLGYILVAKSDEGICAIMMGNGKVELISELQHRFPAIHFTEDDKYLDTSMTAIIKYIEAPTLSFDHPLDIQGTAFQQRVWQILRKIPVGMTASYTDIAQQLGSPQSARAVAKACAANAIAVIIPCHRVVRMNGDISGYRWGVERKKSLLQSESRLIDG